jgi:D-alanyl-D-alanine carboxypeptidase
VPVRSLSRFRRASILAAAGIVGAAVVVAAGPLDRAATVSEPAARVWTPSANVVSISDVDDVDSFVVEAAGRVATTIRGGSGPGRAGSLGMSRIVRGAQVIDAPPAGWFVPVVYVSFDDITTNALYGFEISTDLGPDTVIMNQLTAAQSGAAVGDVIELRTVSGSIQSFTIARILSHQEIGGSDLLFSRTAVERLGVFNDTNVVVYGIDSRDAFDAAALAEGLTGRTDTKISRSWDLRDPDGTLSTPRLHEALGRPWYRPLADGTLDMHPDWRAAHLTDGRVLLNASIPIRAQCNLGVLSDLQAALAEVAAAGLAGTIDVANANAYGGCYAPRLSRISGYLSRHAYAVAFDTNTVSNCQGCTPRMNCDVVRIFRKHGFAWGGNFRRPDGMHFEWVGEPRHQIAFPSKYYPNLVAPTTTSGTAGDTVGSEVLLDGLDTDSHEHDT